MPGKQPPPSLDTFHKERSKLIDGFARVEASLVKAIVRAGGLAKRDTLATKLKTFRDQRSGKLAKGVEAQLQRIQELNALRTDIVHSTIALIDHDDERFAIFSNAGSAAAQVQSATRLTYGAMKAIAAELTEAAAAIDQA